VQIPKAQKKTDNLNAFFALLGSARIKAARRTLMKFTPGDAKHEQIFVFCNYFLLLLSQKI